jgi:indole-3-glycerol phosphate synthase
MLEKLYAAKAAARTADEARESLEVVRARAATRTAERRPFRAALLAADGPAIVAEIKRSG